MRRKLGRAWSSVAPHKKDEFLDHHDDSIVTDRHENHPVSAHLSSHFLRGRNHLSCGTNRRAEPFMARRLLSRWRSTIVLLVERGDALLPASSKERIHAIEKYSITA